MASCEIYKRSQHKDHKLNTESNQKKADADLKERMNRPQYCFFCRRVTETFEWDCKVCNFSKPYIEKGEK